MSDDSLEIEERKLALDERRLAFEVRQYDDSAASRSLADEKAREELNDLKRPFYKKPAYLTPLATICAVVAGGLITFGTDVFKSKISDLHSQLTSLKTSVSKQERERSGLEQINRNLSATQASLKTDNDQLKKDSVRLEKENAAREKDVSKAEATIASLSEQEKALREQLPLQKAQAILALIDKNHPPYIQFEQSEEPDKGGFFPALSRQSQEYVDIAKLMEDPIYGKRITSFVAEQHATSTYSVLAKPALSQLLYKVTLDSKWKNQLELDDLAALRQQLARGDDGEHLGYMEDWYIFGLLNGSLWNVSERARHASQLYDQIRKTIPNINNSGGYYAGRLLYWDNEALAEAPQVWLFCLRTAVKEHDLGKIHRMSLQAYAVETMNQISSGTLYGNRIPSFWNKDTCQLPISVPLCHDSEKAVALIGARITLEQVPAYKAWLTEHPKQAQF